MLSPLHRQTNERRRDETNKTRGLGTSPDDGCKLEALVVEDDGSVRAVASKYGEDPL